MLLAIDIGNTNIVLGCLEGKEILFTERLSTDHQKTAAEYAILFRSVLTLNHVDPEAISGTMISSVVPPITALMKNAVHKFTDTPVMVVGPGVKTGLNILMDNPAQVGSDLIVAAVAGIEEYTCPLIIIDLGTATTISVVDTRHNYIGGMILPGVRVSLDSLSTRTSQLPRISLDPPKKLLGKNTIDCMKSGILYGNASCIDGMVDRIQEELGCEATVIATGGLAESIVPLCKHKVIVDDELLLKGLRIIYEKNR